MKHLNVILLASVMLLSACSGGSKTTEQAKVPEAKKYTPIAVVCDSILHDDVYQVKQVYFEPKQKQIYVAIGDYKDGGFPMYFIKQYHIEANDSIDGVVLFAYNKNLSFEKGTYQKSMGMVSKRISERMNKITEKYTGSFIDNPVKRAIKEMLADSDGFDMDKCAIQDYSRELDLFTVKFHFKAKNAFGVLVWGSGSCMINDKGQVSMLKIDR